MLHQNLTHLLFTQSKAVSEFQQQQPILLLGVKAITAPLPYLSHCGQCPLLSHLGWLGWPRLTDGRFMEVAGESNTQMGVVGLNRVQPSTMSVLTRVTVDSDSEETKVPNTVPANHNNRLHSHAAVCS